jgi:7-carboxy-7-deazaguanine synthase
MINIQPIEKPSLGDGSSLSVHSIFFTIQGEGPFAGHPAVFIRLAGCNLQCSGCDTEYTEGRQIMPIDHIVTAVYTAWNSGHRKFHPLVVITGGEPFRQNVTGLANFLMNASFKVQIETNGTLAPPLQLHNNVVIVCSPKTPKINPILAERADAFKYVLSHDSIAQDGLPFNVLDEKNKLPVARPPIGYMGKIYLQPMDTQDMVENKRNQDAVVKSCMTNGYIVQLQLHKILGMQ